MNIQKDLCARMLYVIVSDFFRKRDDVAGLDADDSLALTAAPPAQQKS